MNRLKPLALVLVLACPGPAPSEPPDPDHVGDSDPEPRSTANDTTDPAPADEGSSVVVEPTSDDGCERVCGGMHDCMLAEPDSTATPHQAAALELDCLRQCVETGPALVDSRFGACADASGCGELLPCMRDAWPDAPDEPIPDPIIEPTGSEGCRLGCKRLGECFDAAPDEIDACANGCEKQLDSIEMKAFGECLQITDCKAMLECMIAFPGAGPNPT